MYNVSNGFKEASKQPVQEHRLTGTVGNVSFDESNVFEGSFNIQKQCTDSSGIVLGSAYIGQLTATFTGLNISRGSWVGKTVTPSFGLKVGNSWEDVPLGSYKIKEVVHTAEGTQVTAYDNMAKFDKVIKNKKATIGFVTDSMFDFVYKCCEKCHVTLATTKAEIDALPNGYRQQGDIEVYGDAGDNDFANDIETYRDLLYWCCQTMGAYATMNRYNQLVIRPYTQTVVEEINDTVRLSGAHFEDYITHFTGIYVTDMDTNDEVYYGYDASELTTQLEETAADISDINTELEDNAEEQAELERKHEAHEITDEEYAQQKAELVAEAKDLRSDKKKLEKRLGWLEQELQKAQDDDEGATLDLGANPFLQYENITKRDNTRRRVLNALANISYTPFTCSLICGAHYDLGDVIHFTGGHASDDYCCVMSWSYTHNQGTELEGFGTDTDEHARRVKDRARKDAHAAGSTAANTGHTFVAEDSQSTETGAPRTGKSGDLWMQTDVTHTYTSRYPIEFSTAYEDSRDTRVVDAKDRCETTEQGYWNVGVAGSIDWSEGSAHYNFNKGVPIYAVHITEPGTYKWHCKIMYTSTFDPQYASTSKFAGFVLYPNDNTTGPDQCVPPSDIVCPPDSVWHDNNTDCDMGANVSLEPGIHEYSGEIIFDSTTFPTGECYLWLFFYRACTVYRTPQVESMECTFALAINDFYFEKVTNPSTGDTDGGVIDAPTDVLKDVKYNQNGTWKSVEYIAKAEADESEDAGGAEWNGVNVVNSTENKNVKFSLKKNVMRAWYKADPPQTQRNFSQFCVRYTGEPDKSLEITSHADHTWANIDIKTDDENAFKIKSGGVGGSGKYCSYAITGLTVGTRYYFNFAANFSDNATFGDDTSKGLGLVFNTTGEIATDAWAGAPDTFNEETLYYSMRRDITKHYADFDFEATATTMYMCVVTADVTSAEAISLTLSEFVISKSERKLIRNIYLYDYEKNTWLKYKPFGGTVGSGGDSGGSVVEIAPTLSAGTKIADYSIDGATGALYAPNGGSGGTQAIELTKAQYDALSPEEKADTSKVYYIKDYPAGSRLANLDDVNLTSPVDGQILKYQDEEWVNVTLTKNMVGLGNVPNVTTDNQTPTVTEASTRANLATGDTLKTIIGKIKKFFSDLKTVAFTGAYSDLTGTPTIGNGTITIQKNGTNVNTFTANQSSNKTVNITMSKSDVGLGNVDNTSDASKPVSAATQAALDNKADASEIASVKTVTGNPISISDGSETYADELVIDLEPIQDLHGYDHPWVGGAGKNKLEITTTTKTIKGVTFTVNGDGSITANGTTTETNTFINLNYESDKLKVEKGVAYKLLAYTSDLNLRVQVVASSGSLYATNDSSTTPTEFTIPSTDTATANWVRVQIQSSGVTFNNATIKPILMLAYETDYSWTPYKNISQIIGYTKVDVDKCGKNLWDSDGFLKADGWVKNTDGSYSGNVTKINYQTYSANTNCLHNILNYSELGENYTASFNVSANSGLYFGLQITDVLTGTTRNVQVSRITETSIVLSTDCSANERVTSAWFSYQTTSTNVTLSNFQLEKDSATTYEPYSGTSLTTPLGRTVYGTTIDVVNGKMIIKKVTETYDGSESEGWVAVASGENLYYRKPLTLPANVTRTNVMICSHYERKAVTSSNTDINIFNVLNASSGTIPAVAIRPDISVYTNTTLFKNFLAAQAQAGTPVQVSYYLLNPITIYLTPKQLKLLKGYNYIISNGTTVHLTYQPDNAVGDAVTEAEKYADRIKLNPVTILDDVGVSGSSTQYTIPDISQYTMVQFVLITCPASGVAYVRDTKTIPVSVLLHNITAYTYNHIITLLAIDPSTANAWTECRIEMNSTTQISVRSDSGASSNESPRLSIIAW